MSVVLKHVMVAILLMVSHGAFAAPMSELNLELNLVPFERQGHVAASSSEHNLVPYEGEDDVIHLNREISNYWERPKRTREYYLNPPPQLVNYQHSVHHERVPKDRENLNNFFEYYGQFAEYNSYGPHVDLWQDTFDGKTDWDRIYWKCYFTLEVLGYNGLKAGKLLDRYGNDTMGNILLLNDIEYDRKVVLELLDREEKDKYGIKENEFVKKRPDRRSDRNKEILRTLKMLEGS